MLRSIKSHKIAYHEKTSIKLKYTGSMRFIAIDAVLKGFLTRWMRYQVDRMKKLTISKFTICRLILT